MNKILIINVCKEKLHYYEFVKPIEDIVKENYFVKHYLEITKKDLERADKVIICGTSLKDNEFVKDAQKFNWIKELNTPILGICAGMQLIGMVFGGKICKKTEIGFYYENFEKDFIGISGKKEVYHLHNNYVDFSNLKEFDVFCKNGNIVQTFKHREKDIYGVLFHPEVRQREIISNFVNLK